MAKKKNQPAAAPAQHQGLEHLAELAAKTPSTKAPISFNVLEVRFERDVLIGRVLSGSVFRVEELPAGKVGLRMRFVPSELVIWMKYERQGMEKVIAAIPVTRILDMQIGEPSSVKKPQERAA